MRSAAWFAVSTQAKIAAAATIISTAAAEVRGRVMGVRMLAVYGLAIGLPIAGVLIDTIGYVQSVWLFVAIDIMATAAIAYKWRHALWS